MPDWPLGGGSNRYQSIGQNAAASLYTAVNCPYGAKGSWTQLSSGLDCPAAGFFLHAGFAKFTNATFAVDLAIGAAGSEQIIAENIILNMTSATNGTVMFLPLKLPAGVPISARGESGSSGTNAVIVGLTAVGPSFAGAPGFSRAYAYNVLVNAFAAKANAYSPGSTANAKAPWAEMAAATVAPHKALSLRLYSAAATNTASSYLIDIGIGPAGSEQVLIPDLPAVSGISFSSLVLPEAIGPLPVDLPAGTRLALRAQSSQNQTLYNTFYPSLYGFS